MDTTTTLPIATRKAIRFFNDNKGSLRTNSNAYRKTVEEIIAADDPMAVAKQRVKSVQRVRSREKLDLLADAVKRAYTKHRGNPAEGEHVVNTRSLDAVVSLVRSGFRNGHLDAQHRRMIAEYEREVFAGKATLDSLRTFAKLLASVDVFDPRTGRWIRFDPTLKSMAG